MGGDSMKSLVDYDILVSDVFYRSEHVLDYLERHKNLSELDREAIENTILDALVASKEVDPTSESLDLEKLAICDDLDHKVYESQPRITSIPLEMKEEMRKCSFQITGGIPLSVFYAKPAGNVSFCIYDMNTALSTLFEDFSFVNCTYDSLTRPGVRSDVRPFLEVEYADSVYYIDALTKRMFRKDWFDQEFNPEESFRVRRCDFNEKQEEIYREQTSDYLAYDTMISLMQPLISTLKESAKSAEMDYEFEKSKEYYPEQFEAADRLSKEFEHFVKFYGVI